MKVGVMRGQLRDYPLAQVLEVLGIGRQYMTVEIQLENAPLGTLFVQGGKIVRAETPEAEGRLALLELLRQSSGEFLVSRLDPPEVFPEPIGDTRQLLTELSATARTSQPASVDAGGAPAFSELESPTHPSSLPFAGVTAPLPPVRPAPRPSASPSRSPAPPATRFVSGVPGRISVAPTGTTPSVPPTERRSVPVPPDLSYIRRAKSRLFGRILTIASPKGGCGKTTVALNLSISLARQGRSVVLVDTDINGDVLSAINARQRAEIGAYDVVLGVASSEEALLDTVLPHFKIMPAVGAQLPRADLLSADHSASFRALLFELAKRTEIVVVDTPAGMFGVTQQVLNASTHVMGVLQAEAVASRSFPRFLDSLRAMPDELRPEVLGIVVNMLQTKHAASLAVFQSACSELPGEWLFDTSIPRHKAFLDSTQAGLPLRHLDDQSPPAVAWLFDNLAAEVAERLRLGAVEKKPQPLLI